MNPPSVVCPGNITERVGPSSTGTTVSWIEPTATDDSNIQPILISRSHVPNISVFNAGAVTPVTYVFSDNSGNRASCSFTIHIIRGKYFGTRTYQYYYDV